MHSLHVSQKGSLVHFQVAFGAGNSSRLLLLWCGPYTSEATLVGGVGEVCFDQAWMAYHHLGLLNIDLKACPLSTVKASWSHAGSLEAIMPSSA